MPKRSNLARFVPGEHYHIFNRTNNRELLFLDDQDRRYFLQQCSRLLGDYVEMYAYCLLPNHFHLAINVRYLEAVLMAVQAVPLEEQTLIQQKFLKSALPEVCFNDLLISQFTRLFTVYAAYFNKRYGRKGNLFHRPFKRIHVQSVEYQRWLIYYIHSNPCKHGICADFRTYQWSSFTAILSAKPTRLCRYQVFALFGGRTGFLRYHECGDFWCPENFNLEIED